MLIAEDDQIGVTRQGTDQHMIVVRVVGDDSRHAGRYGHGGQAPELAHARSSVEPACDKSQAPFAV